jgi:hypothetical protein
MPFQPGNKLGEKFEPGNTASSLENREAKRIREIKEEREEKRWKKIWGEPSRRYRKRGKKKLPMKRFDPDGFPY